MRKRKLKKGLAWILACALFMGMTPVNTQAKEQKNSEIVLFNANVASGGSVTGGAATIEPTAEPKEIVTVTPFSGLWKYYGQKRTFIRDVHYAVSDEKDLPDGVTLTISSETAGKQQFVLKDERSSDEKQKISYQLAKNAPAYEIRAYHTNAVAKTEKDTINIADRTGLTDDKVEIEAPAGYRISSQASVDPGELSYQWYRVKKAEDAESFESVLDETGGAEEDDLEADDDEDDDEEDDSDDDGTYELDAIHKFAANVKEEDDVTTIDGAAAIKGATGLTYKVTKEDIGYRLICQVKAKKYSGYLAGQTTTYVPKLIPEIPKVTLGSFVYSNKKKLSSIRLPKRFSWVDSTIVPVYGNSGYRAKYVPENETMYRTVIIRVKVPVKKKALTKKMIRLKKKYAYEGKAIKGNETVKDGKEVLDSGKDYKASYQNNKNLGKATITIKGIGNYKGTKKVSYTIVKRSVRSVTCHYKKTKSYTGRWVKPNVTLKVGKVKLEKNRDYTLVYRNNLQIGKASVVIQGMGNFTGKKTISFKIVPQTPKIQKLKKNKKSFAITYSSGKMVHGYQMEVSTASSFAAKKTQKYILNGNRFEACGLKKGTYYIRVKAYYSKKGKRYESGYTSKRKIKIKK